VFNPYAHVCKIHDKPSANSIRQNSLRDYLTAALENNIETMWFGRDLGYRGGRRTGIALTDEAHLSLLSRICGSPNITKATTGEIVAERTANVIWGLILEMKMLPFLWNAFPYHPHEPEDDMSNRTHSKKELDIAWRINEELLNILQPKIIVAIGGDAKNALEKHGVACQTVRHPSYGGQADFITGMRRIYKLDKLNQSADLELLASGDYLRARRN